MDPLPSTPPASEPRWHRRKEARPTEILEAALAEFVERGYAAARLEDIAKRAGCTKGTIFLYFANKEELFKGVVRANVIPRIELSEQIVAEHQGPVRDLLVKLLRLRWEGIYDPRLSGLPKLMFSEAGNFPDLARFFHDEVMARSHALIERVLRLGIERGEFRPLDVHSTARFAVTPIVMAALWKHSFAQCGAPVDPVAYFESSLDVLLRGIAREGTPFEGEA